MLLYSVAVGMTLLSDKYVTNDRICDAIDVWRHPLVTVERLDDAGFCALYKAVNQTASKISISMKRVLTITFSSLVLLGLNYLSLRAGIRRGDGRPSGE